jgi:hypothetical protein
MKKTALTLAAITSMGLSAQSPIQIKSEDSSMKLGFMTQMSYEAVGSPGQVLEGEVVKMDGTTQNIFLRRMRLMWSGSIGDKFEYFIETDNANLGKGDANGNKTNSGLVIQDAVLTYKFTNKIKLDAGLILVPLSHHSTQGATNLHSWDYSAYGFQQSSGMGSSVNRDTGVQLRGIVGPAKGNLEFRAGVWQGKRSKAIAPELLPVPDYADAPLTVGAPARPGVVANNNSLRVAARAQWNFFDSEGGLFMGGTYLGAKKILSVGVGHDRQGDYSATAVDVFVDMPLGQDGVMGQLNHVTWDGGDWIPLAKQTTDFAELGYRIGSLKLSPMVRYESRKMDTPTVAMPDETRMGVGLAWWFKGHQSNLKAFYTQVKPKDFGDSYSQINVQWQLLFW